VQYPALKRQPKMAQVLAIYSILEIAMGNLEMMSDRDFIFGYPTAKATVFKIVRKLFRGVGYVIEITQKLRRQEMVSRCSLQ
jgi:hypothetical protein